MIHSVSIGSEARGRLRCVCFVRYSATPLKQFKLLRNCLYPPVWRLLPHARLPGNGKWSSSRAKPFRKKPAILFMCARWSRVKFWAVKMRNAKRRNHLKVWSQISNQNIFCGWNSSQFGDVSSACSDWSLLPCQNIIHSKQLTWYRN